jgi:anti-anti-sigma factor
MTGSHSVYRLRRQDRDGSRSRRAGRRPHLRSPRAAHLSFGPDTTTGTATIVLSGELDLTVTPSLSEHLAQVLARRPRNLVFDMTRVGFIDCAAARLIAGTRRSLPDGRRPVLRHPGYAVRRILELTGLDADCEILAAGCEIEAGQEHRDRFTTP